MDRLKLTRKDRKRDEDALQPPLAKVIQLCKEPKHHQPNPESLHTSRPFLPQ
jgi:hypothetical protein